MNSTPIAERVPGSVVASYTVALGGQNILFAIQLNFLMFAFTDLLGLMPLAVGTLLLLARVFDAVNDPLMGYVVDRTRTRWGKFRPWLLISPVPLGLLTVAMFYNPGLPPTETLIYAYVIYFAWTIIYTLTDVPIWSLTATMTRNVQERTRVVSIARVGSIIGIGIAAIFVPIVATLIAPESKQEGYFFAVLLFTCIAVPALFLAFFGVREQVTPKKEQYTLAQQFQWLRDNRPLQLLVISSLLGFMSVAGATIVPYYAEYVLGNLGLAGPLMGALIVGVIAGIFPTMYLARYFSKTKLNIWSALLRFFIGLAYFFVGFDNLPLIFLFSFLIGVLSGPGAVLIPVMIGDTIDHMEKKTGVRSEAIAFAAFTFSNKASSGLAAWVTGMLLAVTGYVANQVQTGAAIEGIFWLVTLLPAISALVSIIPLFFYQRAMSHLAD
jgi:probable glucitol transport protein GutA